MLCKAANAGGVSVSGLEMTQNSIKLSWSQEEVDEKLKSIMKNIHEACVQDGTEPDGYINYGERCKRCRLHESCQSYDGSGYCINRLSLT